MYVHIRIAHTGLYPPPWPLLCLSRIAQTTKDWPLCMSPAANTFATLVTIFPCRRCHIGPFIHFYSECLGNIVLAADESGSDQHQVALLQYIRSPPTSAIIIRAGLLVLLCFQFHQNSLAHSAFLIFLEFFDCCLVNPRIMAEDCLGLTAAHSPVCRSWAIPAMGLSCVRSSGAFGIHLQLQHGFGAVAHGGPHAVISRIASADHHDFPAFGRNIIRRLLTAFHSPKGSWWWISESQPQSRFLSASLPGTLISWDWKRHSRG